MKTCCCYVSEDESCDPKQDLGLQHLVWGQVRHKVQGRKTSWHPQYAIVEAQAAVQQVFISPHFAFWQAADRSHFLLNGMLDLWPPADLNPHTVPSSEEREEVCEVGAWTLT